MPGCYNGSFASKGAITCDFNCKILKVSKSKFTGWIGNIIHKLNKTVNEHFYFSWTKTMFFFCFFFLVNSDKKNRTPTKRFKYDIIF